MLLGRHTPGFDRLRIKILFLTVLVSILYTSGVLFNFDLRLGIFSKRITEPAQKDQIHIQKPEASSIDVPKTTFISSIKETSTAEDRIPTSVSEVNDDEDKDGWYFDSARDARTFTLSDSQCSSAFSNLFIEIERAVEYRKSIGNVTPEDIDISWQDDGGVRAMIFDQQLFIIESRFSSSFEETRSVAILHAINRAIITSPSPLPNIEFSFTATDIADPQHLGHTIWALSRTNVEVEKWVMSDFGYWSWALELVGEYQQIRDEISVSELSFEEKRKQVVWRGSVSTNKQRESLIAFTKGKSWADVQSVEWATATQVRQSDKGKTLTIPENCQYQFLIQTEGRSYSGRGKYLQNCNSVVLMSNRTWVEPQHNLLISSGPNQNFVEIQDDFSDLEEKVLDLVRDQEKAKRIARNSIDTFRDRHLTPAAQVCYWRRLITSWSAISFVPEKYEPDSWKLRGVPFETFSVQAVTSKSECSWIRWLTFRC